MPSESDLDKANKNTKEFEISELKDNIIENENEIE